MNLTKILAGLLLVLAIALGIGAWMLSRQPVRQVAAPSAPAPAAAPTAPTEMHNVVVAAKAVPAGQRLTAEDLKVAQLPAAVASGTSAQTLPVTGDTEGNTPPSEADTQSPSISIWQRLISDMPVLRGFPPLMPYRNAACFRKFATI